MLILGIETSCDETSASILELKHNRLSLLSNIVASSLTLHAKTGGIIPEEAARQQLIYIIPVIKEAFRKARISFNNFPVDKIAVTYGPGLIGSLLVGVETARTMSYVFKKGLIPVNHLIGHIYANWIEKETAEISFPAIALVISGGHTDLILMKNHKNLKWLGGTRDDAAGEAFDKIGRLMNLPYPAGPIMEKLARDGDPNFYNLPSPLIASDDYDFSFSGLKTAALRKTKELKKLDDQAVKNISAAVQSSISNVLVKKTLRAAKAFKAKSLLLGGGVAANGQIKKDFEIEIRNKELKTKLFVPKRSFCTDNAAMIASAAFFTGKAVSWQKIDADPSLHF
jgi:N6-L-threonylcarbamoyladenine synthase